MILLLCGLLLFFINHSLRLLAPGWRDRFIDQYGDNTWKALYSLFSLAGLALIVYGYQQSRLEPVLLWNPPLWSRHLALLLTWVAFILIAASCIPANHLKQRIGHPLYAGVKLWALAHLLANGRLGDVLLFGTFLLWAVLGFALSRRRDRRAGLQYPAGRSPATVLTVLAGSLGWAVFAFWLHLLLIGVAPIA